MMGSDDSRAMVPVEIWISHPKFGDIKVLDLRESKGKLEDKQVYPGFGSKNLEHYFHWCGNRLTITNIREGKTPDKTGVAYRIWVDWTGY